jgi:hypothetical protein
MADTRPANLELSNLIISPAEAGIGKNVTVSVLVTNTGDLPGSQAVTLKMDDEVKQTQTVTVEGQESQNIVFTVSSDVTGSHTIAINSLSGTFTVKEGTVATSAPEPTPTSTAAPASTPTSAPPAPPSLTPTTLTSNPPPVSSLPTTPASSQEPALKPTNRLILVGLIAAVVAIIGLVFGLRWWRRRSARREAFLTQNGRRYNGRKV